MSDTRKQKSINYHRIQKDLLELSQSFDFEVGQDVGEYYIIIFGPEDSMYKGGVFKIRVTVGKNYPLKSPSVGFATKIYHPNIDLNSGSVCLNVLNETWSPVYTLKTICELFLPHLLRYPNENHPLNPEAGSLYKKNRNQYLRMVKKYLKRSIKENPIKAKPEIKENEPKTIEQYYLNDQIVQQELSKTLSNTKILKYLEKYF